MQQGRFTASARSNNGNEVALLDGKIDSAQGLDVPFVELASQSFGLEEGAGRRRRHLLKLSGLPRICQHSEVANELRSIVVVVDFILGLVQGILLLFDLFLRCLLTMLSLLF